MVLTEQDAGCLDILRWSWIHIIQLLGHLALPRIAYMAIEDHRADIAFVGYKGEQALRLIVRSVGRMLHGNSANGALHQGCSMHKTLVSSIPGSPLSNNINTDSDHRPLANNLISADT
jgi:hypothetical protein